MSNAATLAKILRKLADAHYQAADELGELAASVAIEQPGAEAVPPVASAPADDLPPMAGEPVAKSRDQLYAECPDHQRPWTVKEGGISKAGKPYKAFWKCNGTNPDGTYCNKKPDASWVRAHDPEQALLRGAA